jgi:hypothetical protein
VASSQTDVDKRIRVADCILTDVDKIVSLLHHLVCKEALHRCHIPLVIMFRYFSIFFDIFQVRESSRMKARRQSITESETSKQSNQECPLEVQSRKLIQTSDWFLQHLPHGASTSLLKFMYHGLEKLSFFLLLVFINMFSWTCRNLE